MANKAVNFIKEVKAELGKVSWSTKEELTYSSMLVIISMLMLGAFIWVCDIVFVRIVDIILKF